MCGFEDVLPVLAPIALSFLAPGLGTAIGTGLGLAEGGGAATLGGALLGAGTGAATSAISGGNPLTGALTGGIGGGIGPNIGDIFDGITGVGTPSPAGSSVSGSGGGATGPAVGSAPGPASVGAGAGGGAGSISAPASVGGIGSDITSGTNLSNVVAPGPTLPSGFSGAPSSVSVPNIGGASVSGAGAGAGGGSSFSNFLKDPSFSSFGNALKSNASALPSVAGLGISAISGNNAPHDAGKIGKEAQDLTNQGNSLMDAINSGNLPPGLQAGLNQAGAAAKATIRSQYASRGMAGSSAEAQDIAAVDQRIAAQGAEYAMNLLNVGVTETGMAAGLYKQLMDASMKQDEALGSAFSSFGAAMAGGGTPGKTIQISV